MLNRWLAMNDQDKFTERVFVTVREMYTLVKNLLADIPTSQDHYATHSELEATPPRFDKILLAQSENRRLNSMGCPKLASEIRGRRKKSYFAGVDYKLGSRHRDSDSYRLDPNNIYLGPPMIDTKTFKQQFLAGDKDAVMYTNPKEPKTSSYQTSIKGMQVDGDFRATILDRQWQSFAGAQTFPDPSRMSKYLLVLTITILVYFSLAQTMTKFNSIENDRVRVNQRMGRSMPAAGETFNTTSHVVMNGFRRNNGWIN